MNLNLKHPKPNENYDCDVFCDNYSKIEKAFDDLDTRKVEQKDLPTKTSQLTNDSNFITADDVKDMGGGGVSSWNDLTDRPFYDTQNEEMVFDGSFHIPTSRFATLEEKPFDIVAGDTYHVTWNGETYECVARVVPTNGGFPITQLGNASIQNATVTGVDTGEPFLFEFLVLGGEFLGYVRSTKNDIDAIVKVLHETKEYVTLPTKYLPNGVPYLSVEMVDFITDLSTAELPNDEGMVMIPTFPITEGAKYIVELNGETYECIGKDIGHIIGDNVEPGNALLLGNTVFWGLEDNGLPFCIVCVKNENGDGVDMCCIAELSGKLDNILSVRGEKVEKRKLSEELLPDSLYEIIDLTQFGLTDIGTDGISLEVENTLAEKLLARPVLLKTVIVNSGKKKELIFQPSFGYESDTLFVEAPCEYGHLVLLITPTRLAAELTT